MHLSTPEAIAAAWILAAALGGCAGHEQHTGAMAHAGAADTRQVVEFPAPMREHTLSNMRDHLLAITQIQQALAAAENDRAAQIAEQRLGLSSLEAHGAHELSAYMPPGMQEAGTAMHRAASRFALSARDAAVTGRLEPAIGALAEVTQSCVACHAAYRLR